MVAEGLVGHLASWEEHGLDAVAAWERGERAPIDDLGRMLSTRAINDQNVSRKSGWSFVRVQRESERIHEELISARRKRGGLREITKLPIPYPQSLPSYLLPHLG